MRQCQHFFSAAKHQSVGWTYACASWRFSICKFGAAELTFHNGRHNLFPFIFWHIKWTGNHTITATYTQFRIILYSTLFCLMECMSKTYGRTSRFQAVHTLPFYKTPYFLAIFLHFHVFHSGPCITIQFYICTMGIFHNACLRIFKTLTIPKLTSNGTAAAANAFC